MNLLRTVAALTAVAALATACDDDEPRGAEWPTQDTKSSDATSPDEPTEAPSKPALPDAATKPTKAGAKAFIHYYWDVVNYALTTGKTKPLERITSSSCDTCVALVRDIAKHYRAGGNITGGAQSAEITEISEVKVPDPDVYSFKVTQVVTNEAQKIVYGNGKVDRPAAGENTWIAYVVWVESRWRIDVQDVVSE